MIKGYVIEYNVRCIKTNKKFPDAVLRSDSFGDTFTDIMQNAKVGDTSIAESIQGLHAENGTTIPVVYNQMFVVTEIWLFWVYSSMVEQRPFKSLVEGSNPSGPTIYCPVA